ncbi:MAG: hypothetical protein Q4A32_03495 [Lachnospiraceae bacterium]|nr:hypothetical protein [Lachnospiraceae bacterium]
MERMTIEDAILHAEEVAVRNEAEAARMIGRKSIVKSLNLKTGGSDDDTDAYYDRMAERALRYAEEHRQLADWLRELQAWRKAYDDCVNTNYESIDDSVKRFAVIGQVVSVKNVFANIRRTDG